MLEKGDGIGRKWKPNRRPSWAVVDGEARPRLGNASSPPVSHRATPACRPTWWYRPSLVSRWRSPSPSPSPSASVQPSHVSTRRHVRVQERRMDRYARRVGDYFRAGTKRRPL
ncbi:hypothetical protein ZWY2020_030968 [Hordeum vulgare]|nr:hypothetical protein ZWY2020_030968 [Hordeum vulgare]